MLDLAKCEEILTHLIEPEDVAGFFVCGPGPMMDAAEEALLERGVDKHKIHTERFTADRPSAAVEAQMHALPDPPRGLTMKGNLAAPKPRVACDAQTGNTLVTAPPPVLPAPYACQPRAP